jgi:hypothetical protein
MVTVIGIWRPIVAWVARSNIAPVDYRSGMVRKIGVGVVNMKILVVIQVFAFMAFLFVPSIAFLMFIAFLTKSTWWFVFLGLPALVVNGVLTLVEPGRSLIRGRLRKISGAQG